MTPSRALLLRLSLALAALCMLTTATAATAQAATYYVKPNGFDDVCTTVTRCTLETGLGKAVNSGDIVDLDFGTYAIPAAGYTTATGVTVRGLSSGGTILNGANTTGTGVIKVGTSGTLSDMRINSLAGDGVHFLNGSTGNRLDIRSFSTACVPDAYPVSLYNSVCAAGDTGITNALHATLASGYLATLTLRNVTLVSDQQPLRIDPSQGGDATLVNVAVYARNPATPDCSVKLSAGNAFVFTSDRSSYPAVAGPCGDADVTLVETERQDARPTFVAAGPNPATADYHEIATSPTRNAGRTDALNGPFDLDRHARTTIDDKTDIGAYEFFDAPTVAAQAATAITTTGATLNATVNNHGVDSSSTFTYGTVSSADTILDAHAQTPGFSEQPVSDTLTGLTPGTTYVFRLCSSSLNSSSCTPDQQFVTSSVPAVIAPLGQLPTAPGGGSPAAPTTTKSLAGSFAVRGKPTSKKGVITVLVDVPGAGALSAKATYKPVRRKAKTYGSTRATPKAGGTVRLTIKPTAASKKALKKAKKLKLTIKVSFTPKGAKLASKTTTLTVKP